MGVRLPRGAGLLVTRGLSRVPGRGESQARRGHHATGPEPLTLVRMDRPHLRTRLEMALLDFRTHNKRLSLQRRSVAGFEISDGEGKKPSQQTVVTEGLCGKMVKFGLKQAVSLVMSCC